MKSQMPSYLNIAAIGEESFKFGLAVLIKSVATSCVAASDIRFFILDLNLTPATRKKLTQTVDGLGRSAAIEFLDPKSSRMLNELNVILARRKRNFKERCWFAKFAIPDLLSSRTDHVFYLDSDIYCGLDLSLARQLQGASPLCAVIDGATKAVGASVEFSHARLAADASYFNAGLLGIDLAYWKKNNLSEKALAIADEFGTQLIDQGLFNVLFYRNWMELPWDWNYQCPFRYGLFEEIGNGKRIINLHYLTNPKPWQVPIQPANVFFYRVLDQTAFRGWRPNAFYWTMHLKVRTLKYRLHKLTTSMISLGRKCLSRK